MSLVGTKQPSLTLNALDCFAAPLLATDDKPSAEPSLLGLCRGAKEETGAPATVMTKTIHSVLSAGAETAKTIHLALSAGADSVKERAKVENVRVPDFIPVPETVAATVSLCTSSPQPRDTDYDSTSRPCSPPSRDRFVRRTRQTKTLRSWPRPERTVRSRERLPGGF
jgi:hypothetical protein